VQCLRSSVWKRRSCAVVANDVDPGIVIRGALAKPVPIDSVFLGDRVALRAPKPTDAKRLVEIQYESQDFFAPWTSTPTPEMFDVRATRARILQERRDFKADRSYKLCFTLGPKGPIIGRVSLSQVYRSVFQNAYLGYFIDVRYHRQGLTTEAVRVTLDAAFGPIGLHRVQAAIMPNNEASLALARRIGMRLEGCAERYLQIAGRWQDLLIFAITAEEWRK
jgi:[ribosomal protein S5]-alanine N-acetyltransferase